MNNQGKIRRIQSNSYKGCTLACLMTWVMVAVQAQNPQLQWAVQTMSPVVKNIDAMAMDGDGNTLICISSQADYTFAGTEISTINTVDGSWTASTLIKVDAAGEVVWTRTLKGPWQTRALCGGVDTDEDNNIYVTYSGRSTVENASTVGGLYVASTQSRADFLVKLDADGNGLWFIATHDLNTTVWSTETPVVKAASAGGAYHSKGFFGTVSLDNFTLVNEALESLYLAKTDADGQTLWAKSIFSNTGLTEIDDMVEGPDGSLYLAGYWSGDSLHVDHLALNNDLAFTGNGDRWICKIGPDGETEWLVREHSAAVEDIAFLAMTPEGNLLVVTYTDASDLHVGDLVLSGAGQVHNVYNPAGEVLSATLIGPTNGSTQSIVSLNDGAYLVAGAFSAPMLYYGGLQASNEGGTTGTSDIFIASINIDGEAAWIYTIGGEESEGFPYLKALNSTSFVVGGRFIGAQLTIQGTQLVNSTPFNREQFLASFNITLTTRTAEALQQLLAYPNPFSENVQFDAAALHAFGDATLVVFNTSGLEVYRKQLQGHEPGQISLGHLPKGAYIARLSDGKRSLHTKIIKQ